MGSILDKIKNENITRNTGGKFSKQTDIWFKFKDGENVIRLVGGYLRVDTHYLAPAIKRKDRGLCPQDVFDRNNENPLPISVNCLNWDVANEKPMADGHRNCPICKLWRIAQDKLRDKKLPEDQKKFYDNLKQKCRPVTNFKWNIIDRANPQVTETTPEGEVRKILGYKVASFGMEAFGDIKGIFMQLEPRDLSDKDQGADVIVEKTSKSDKTSYSARVVMKGGVAAETTLSSEERKMVAHDLMRLNGKMTDPEAIVAALHDDIKEVLEAAGGIDPTTESEGGDESDEPAEEETPAPAPKTAQKAAVKEALPTVDDDDADADDEDDVPAPADDTKDWECLGTIEDEDHPECSKCTSLAKCVAKRDEKKAPKKASKK